MALAMSVVARSSMRAVLVEKPVSIDSLKLVEMMVPSVPDDGVLVRVLTSSANPVDMFPTSWAGYLMGGRKPVVIGTDFAGVVEAVGKDVSAFRPGDEVFGGARGAFAEYMVVRESRAIAHKPASVSFEQAGTVAVAATTALQALRDHGGLSSGQSVLINGASGGVGTFAVQIASALGGLVTAVCGTRNVEMARSLGASAVIDYTRDDFTRGVLKYDLVIDVAGSHSFSACKRVLKPHGTFVGVGAAGVQHGRGGGRRAIGHFLATRLTSIGGSRKVVTLFIANLTAQDMEFLASLLANGRVTPVIDRRYSLDEVSEALQYLNEGHGRAKVAISV